MVINLDPVYESGTHWIALFAKNMEQLYYFDSYALPPNKIIGKYLENYKKVTRNKKSYQSVFSSVCGQYCIYFIYMLSLNLSFDELIKLLDNSINSDLFVKSFVQVFK
jgi:hypothetical protein